MAVYVAYAHAVLSLFSDIATNTLTDGRHYGKFGTGHPDLVPYQAFAARDGYFKVACLTNAFFKRLCDALERPDLLADPRFASNRARVEHRAEIVPVLERPSARATATSGSRSSSGTTSRRAA